MQQVGKKIILYLFISQWLQNKPMASKSYINPTQSMSWFLRGSWIMGNTCIYNRKAFIQAGGLREDLGSFSDGFLQMVLALKHGACFIPETLAVWRLSPSGYASSSSRSLEPAMKMWSNVANLMRTTPLCQGRCCEG